MPDSEIMKIRRHVLCSALQSSANEPGSADCARLSKEIILDGAARYRCCIHKERAIVEERLKLIS